MSLAASDAADALPHEEPEGARSSYRQILKSTAVIGGSTMINVLFAIVRSKAIALLLGPSGVGLFGLFNSVVDLAQTIAGLGVSASGVRQIARAAADDDAAHIARTATALRRLSLILGALGALALISLSLPVARLTFGNEDNHTAIALLSAAVFFQLVSSGQCALLQGLRRIGDIARFNVLSAGASTVVTVPMVYFFGTEGIVFSIVTIAAVSIGASWWYVRKLKIAPAPMPARAFARETAEMLRLGFAFMASAVFTVGSAYVIRIILLRETGAEGTGLYQAAWALGGLYAGFILQAMGTDFYPKLSAVADRDEDVNRLVNEQTEVSILLAGPGVLATLTLAPLVIYVFYSAAFAPAIDVLRWLSLGIMLRILSWPIGFVVIAKGAQRAFFWIEAAATLVNVGLAWLLVPVVGVSGAGLAFFGLYVWHTLIVYAVVRRMTGFRWSPVNFRSGSAFMIAAAIVFALFATLPFWTATAAGATITAVSCALVAKRLLTLLPAAHLPAVVRPWHGRLARLLRA